MISDLDPDMGRFNGTGIGEPFNQTESELGDDNLDEEVVREFVGRSTEKAPNSKSATLKSHVLYIQQQLATFWIHHSVA